MGSYLTSSLSRLDLVGIHHPGVARNPPVDRNQRCRFGSKPLDLQWTIGDRIPILGISAIGCEIPRACVVEVSSPSSGMRRERCGNSRRCCAWHRRTTCWPEAKRDPFRASVGLANGARQRVGSSCCGWHPVVVLLYNSSSANKQCTVPWWASEETGYSILALWSWQPSTHRWRKVFYFTSSRCTQGLKGILLISIESSEKSFDQSRIPWLEEHAKDSERQSIKISAIRTRSTTCSYISFQYYSTWTNSVWRG